MTTTIITTGPEDQRISFAFGRKLKLLDDAGAARNATAAEVKADIVRFIKAVVRDQELISAQQQIVLNPDIDPQ